MLADRHGSTVAQASLFLIPAVGPERNRVWNDVCVTAELADAIIVRQVGSDANVASGLADVLVDCVEGGASVSFMLPLSRERAEAYWTNALDSASRGERIVMVAEEQTTGAVVGTVQVVLTAPENQPHRGEIAKMLVHRRVRGRGVAEALMRAVEAAALEAGKRCWCSTPAAPTLNVSTTVSAGSASG
jgi:GNAT superfamily N-acetyltransferase